MKGVGSVKQFILIGGIAGFIFSLFLLQRFASIIDILSCLLIYVFVCELYIFMFTTTIDSILLFGISSVFLA